MVVVDSLIFMHTWTSSRRFAIKKSARSIAQTAPSYVSELFFSMLIYCLRHMSVYWVCQEGSVIESSANLGMHGQGLLKLSGHGDSLRAQRLFVSLFYTVHVSDN